MDHKQFSRRVVGVVVMLALLLTFLCSNLYTIQYTNGAGICRAVGIPGFGNGDRSRQPGQHSRPQRQSAGFQPGQLQRHLGSEPVG